MPPVAPILRGSLPATQVSNGYSSFTLPIRKLVLEYCERWVSSEGMRSYLGSRTIGVESMARQFPSVEFIVRRTPHRHPILRGLYNNNRDKVICVRNLPPASIAQKIQLLLDSSGAKLKKEKGHPVKSHNESVRGIYSPFHTPYRGAENLGSVR